MPFTKEEYEEIKRALNNIIIDKISYLSLKVTLEENKLTQESLKVDYLLLEKVLELIENEESK